MALHGGAEIIPMHVPTHIVIVTMMNKTRVVCRISIIQTWILLHIYLLLLLSRQHRIIHFMMAIMWLILRINIIIHNA